VHDPLDADGHYPADPSHSLILGVPVQNSPEAALVKDLMADCVLNPLFPAVQLSIPANEATSDEVGK
jgi:hypothetical protein